ncbi:Rid family hydrolase [Rhodococcus yananensis]|uniref:Rid family hydrolase n=1 Tax=Rhodococcus yananensis TaxID=2879464 RepID=UPI001CF886C8|nr:Rid family hydrolase [Rhodococcus yananensis]
MATGSATNAVGLLSRPVPMTTFGATVVLVEVDDPETVDMPAMMYMKSVDGTIEFGGIVMSPLQYPDGKWYVKVSGRSLLDNPLASTDEIAAWVRTGGRTDDIDETLAVLGELLPGQERGPARTRPCMVCETPTGLPYIDRVDDRTTVVVEGERGAMAADGSIPDDLDAQFEAAFAAISNVLAAAGASLNDIVELVTYHTHLESDLEVFHAVKDRHIGAPYPAWTAVEVTALGAGTAPGARVEIKATAYHRLPH